MGGSKRVGRAELRTRHPPTKRRRPTVAHCPLPPHPVCSIYTHDDHARTTTKSRKVHIFCCTDVYDTIRSGKAKQHSIKQQKVIETPPPSYKINATEKTHTQRERGKKMGTDAICRACCKHTNKAKNDTTTKRPPYMVQYRE